MENIIEKLESLKKRLEQLRSTDYRESDEEYTSMVQLLERIIDRVYPEKDAKQLKSKLHRISIGFPGIDETVEMKQRDYVYDINLAIRVINTITEESKLFGFNDFKPMRERTETEWQVGSDKFGFFRKKKTK